MSYIDTRDLVDRLDELSSMRDRIDELEDEICEKDIDTEDSVLEEELAELEKELDDIINDYDEDELKELENIESEVSDFRGGVTLIPENAYVDYIRERLEDDGTVSTDLPWYVEIDWEVTADNLRSEYSEVEYQGKNYIVMG